MLARSPDFSATRLPGWAAALLAAGGVAIVGLWLVGRNLAHRQREEDEAELAESLPKRKPGQRFIVIAGEQGAGKSALANALIGTDLFGPDARPDEAAQYRGEWWIRELPAAAIRLADPHLLAEQVGSEDIVIEVLDLYSAVAGRSLANGWAVTIAFARQLPAFHRTARFGLALSEARPDVPQLVLANKADMAGQIDGPLTEGDGSWYSGTANSPDGPRISALQKALDQLLEQR